MTFSYVESLPSFLIVLATTSTTRPTKVVSPAETSKRGLPSMKIGRARRIRLSDAEAWLAGEQEA